MKEIYDLGQTSALSEILKEIVMGLRSGCTPSYGNLESLQGIVALEISLKGEIFQQVELGNIKCSSKLCKHSHL